MSHHSCVIKRKTRIAAENFCTPVYIKKNALVPVTIEKIRLLPSQRNRAETLIKVSRSKKNRKSKDMKEVLEEIL